VKSFTSLHSNMQFDADMHVWSFKMKNMQLLLTRRAWNQCKQAFQTHWIDCLFNQNESGFLSFINKKVYIAICYIIYTCKTKFISSQAKTYVCMCMYYIVHMYVYVYICMHFMYVVLYVCIIIYVILYVCSCMYIRLGSNTLSICN